MDLASDGELAVEREFSVVLAEHDPASGAGFRFHKQQGVGFDREVSRPERRGLRAGSEVES